MSKFDSYEIRPVVEYTEGGESFCEPYESQEEAQTEADYSRNTTGSIPRIFWSLYGHIPSQGVLSFFDAETKAECIRLYKLITGCDVEFPDNGLAEFGLPVVPLK